MLELIAIFYLSRKLSSIAQSKGRGRGWGALGAGLWIFGEVLGAVVGALSGEEAMIYIFAIVGALIGGGIAWVIVNSLSAVEGYPMTPGMPYSAPHNAGPYDPSNPYNPGTPPSAYGGVPHQGAPGYGQPQYPPQGAPGQGPQPPYWNG
jgi:MFS family permease